MMKKIAAVIPLLRLPRKMEVFDYLIPHELMDKVYVGSVVKINFRKSKVNGVVWRLRRYSRAKKELKPILDLADLKGLRYISEWQIKLTEWMSRHYFYSKAPILRMLIPKTSKKIVYEIGEKYKDLKISKNVLEKIKMFIDEFNSSQLNQYLLIYHKVEDKMVTYIKLIEKILKKGQQVILLVPQKAEVRDILAYLPPQWKDIIESKIIVGTRSAIFSPIDNLGLIIMDNEHSEHYKQFDQNPRYDARDVALKIATLKNIPILFSSYAPRLETYTHLKQALLILQSHKIPKIRLIDMQKEIIKKNFGMLSDEFIDKLQEVIKSKEKAILFFNRKGEARRAVCLDCGYLWKCQECNLPLVQDGGKLICYHCKIWQLVPITCPHCKGINIRFFGWGIKRLEKELERMFSKSAKEYILINQEGRASLAAIISCDTHLYLPDFRANERTFQMTEEIKHVCIKFNIPNLFIQTWNPQNYAIKSAENYDFSFYKEELNWRQRFKYPPLYNLMRLIHQHPNEKQCFASAAKLYYEITRISNEKELITLKPAPLWIKKVRGNFRYQIILKYKNFLPYKTRKLIENLPPAWLIDRDPISLL